MAHIEKVIPSSPSCLHPIRTPSVPVREAVFVVFNVDSSPLQAIQVPEAAFEIFL
jgi:hypothetical protein